MLSFLVLCFLLTDVTLPLPAAYYTRNKELLCVFAKYTFAKCVFAGALLW